MDRCAVLAPQSGNGVSRAALPVLPVLYLSLALALSKGRAFDRLRPTPLRAVIGVLIAVACTQTIRNGLTLQSPYKQTVAYLRGRRFSHQVVDANWPVRPHVRKTGWRRPTL